MREQHAYNTPMTFRRSEVFQSDCLLTKSNAARKSMKYAVVGCRTYIAVLEFDVMRRFGQCNPFDESHNGQGAFVRLKKQQSGLAKRLQTA